MSWVGGENSRSLLILDSIVCSVRVPCSLLFPCWGEGSQVSSLSVLLPCHTTIVPNELDQVSPITQEASREPDCPHSLPAKDRRCAALV